MQDLGIVPYGLLNLLPQPPAGSGLEERTPEYPPNRGYAGAGNVNVALSLLGVLGWTTAWAVLLTTAPGLVSGLFPGVGLSLLCTALSRHLWGGLGSQIRIPRHLVLLFVPLLLLAGVPAMLVGQLTADLAIALGSAFIGGALGILLGYGINDDPRGWRNEAVMLTPSGEFLPVYGKNHPSSPGELMIVTSGVYPVYDTPAGRFGTIICNDVSYTDSSRILARDGAQLITVPTYETSVPGFHWEVPIQGVLRAVENHVGTVKADTAYSAMIVDRYGRILAHRDGAPEGEAFVLVADVPLGAGNTLNTRLGDWVGWLGIGWFYRLDSDCEQKASERGGKPNAFGPQAGRGRGLRARPPGR